MESVLIGPARKLGDFVTVESICATKYLFVEDPVECASHLFEVTDPGFRERVKPGEILVAGKLFAFGPPHLNAILALQGAGFLAVVAESVSSRFTKTCINAGLPCVTVPSLAAQVGDGDRLEIDLAGGTLMNHSRGRSYRFGPYPPFLLSLLAAGGLKPFVAQRLAAGATSLAP